MNKPLLRSLCIIVLASSAQLIAGCVAPTDSTDSDSDDTSKNEEEVGEADLALKYCQCTEYATAKTGINIPYDAGLWDNKAASSGYKSYSSPKSTSKVFEIEANTSWKSISGSTTYTAGSVGHVAVITSIKTTTVGGVTYKDITYKDANGGGNTTDGNCNDVGTGSARLSPTNLNSGKFHFIQ